MAVNEAAYGHEQRTTKCDSILPPVVRPSEILQRTKLQPDSSPRRLSYALVSRQVVSSRESMRKRMSGEA